jgi:hypothetical protein
VLRSIHSAADAAQVRRARRGMRCTHSPRAHVRISAATSGSRPGLEACSAARSRDHSVDHGASGGDGGSAERAALWRSIRVSPCARGGGLVVAAGSLSTAASTRNNPARSAA